MAGLKKLLCICSVIRFFTHRADNVAATRSITPLSAPPMTGSSGHNVSSRSKAAQQTAEKRAYSSCLFAVYSNGNPPLMRCRAMLPQIDALPRAQIGTAVYDRHAHLGLGKHRAHVRGHVVRTFRTMRKHRVSIRAESCHKRLQVMPHRRVGVFTQDQRGAGVAYKEMTQAPPHARTPNHVLDIAADIIGTASLGAASKRILPIHVLMLSFYVFLCDVG